MDKFSRIFQNKKAFIAYLTAGDTGLNTTKQSALTLIDAGVDILEIGIPFSDPIADGPVIQQAMTRALNEHITINDILNMIHDIKAISDTPIVLFSYYNPLLTHNNQDFYQQAKGAGVDGMLVVDLPLEEAEQHEALCQAADIAPIFIITPSTPVERIQKIDSHTRGFLYYACRRGTTGMRSTLPEDFADTMSTIKTITKNPVVTGFGIADRNSAAAVLECADGFVVGSAFVQAIADNISDDELKAMAQKIDPRHSVQVT